MHTEIKIAVSDLKEALPGLTKIIGKSRTLPVLQSVRIARNSGGIVTLHATDLDSFLTFTTRAAQQGPAEEVLVPLDQLTKAMKCSSPKEDLGIVPESKEKVKIRYNIAGNLVEQTISTLPVDEFPPAPSVRQAGVELEPEFGRALKEALDCCSENSSRHVLKGACLDVRDQKFHYVVGSDGRALFSANSFCFTLQKSVIIPDSKFLSWSDFLDEQPAFLSVEPGKEEVKAKDGKPAQEAVAGWVKLESPRWSFVTREILGDYPNWKHNMPTTDSQWTHVILSEEAVAQLLLVIPNLPGADTQNSMIRLRADRHLTVEGQGNADEKWTRVPVQAVNVNGNPVDIALNRQYLLKALRFGLNKLEIADSLNPMVLSKGGKKMIIMPLRMEDEKVQPKSAAAPTSPTAGAPTSPPPEQSSPQTKPEAQTEERTDMPKKTKTTETVPGTDGKPPTNAETDVTFTSKEAGTVTATNPSLVKSLVDQVEAIKDSLKATLRDLSTMVDTVKAAEKEKRATDKEIEAVRAKLRQIQNVTI